METVIVDAGPLVAYLKQNEADHEWVTEQFRLCRAPLCSCDAALSEAFFLLSGTNGGTERLLGLLERGLVLAAFDLRNEIQPVAQLMRRYANVPMSLADACLVRMAELHPGAAVFTLDTDFRIYRKHRREVIPLITPD